MADQRNQHNIGQTTKTSVKMHQQPGGKSNWSLGWNEQISEDTKNTNQKAPLKYHNQSNLVLGQISNAEEKELKQRQVQKKKRQQELNEKLPTYDPKNGGKSNLFFGDDKTDYRKKDEVYKAVKQPPGGKSSIQFG